MTIDDVYRNYTAYNTRRWLFLAAMLLLLAASVIVSISYGAADMSLPAIMRALFTDNGQ